MTEIVTPWTLRTQLKMVDTQKSKCEITDAKRKAVIMAEDPYHAIHLRYLLLMII